jgi:hypothetical protein
MSISFEAVGSLFAFLLAQMGPKGKTFGRLSASLGKIKNGASVAA